MRTILSASLLAVVLLVWPPLMFSDDKFIGPKPPEKKELSADAQLEYWRQRAILMDTRMELANASFRLQTAKEENIKQERFWSAFVKSTAAQCPNGLDGDALEKEKVLKCAPGK
jgi:hypothetical protein